MTVDREKLREGMADAVDRTALRRAMVQDIPPNVWLRGRIVRKLLANSLAPILDKADSAEAAEARADRLSAEVEARDKRIAELSETWTDENGTIWSPPTAWAYAKACAALHKHRAEVEAKTQALLLLLPFVDFAAGEGLEFIPDPDEPGPNLDAAELCGAAARVLGFELGDPDYVALLDAGCTALARAADKAETEGSE